MGMQGAPTINQTSYRWCNDDGTISVIANEDVDITNRTVDTIHVLALELENTGSASASRMDYQLQFRNITDSGSWTNVGAATDIKYADATNLTNGDSIATGSFKGTNAQGTATTAIAGEENEDSLVNNFDLAADDWTEYWFAIDGGTGGKQYELRLIEDTAEVTVNYNTNPKITYATPGTDYTETPSDTQTLADSVVLDFGNVLSDTHNIADSFAKQSEFFRSFSETESISDSVSLEPGLNPSNTQTISDSLTIQPGINVSDTHTISDNVALSITLNLSDSFTLADAYADDFPDGTDYTLDLSDALTLADTLAKVSAFKRSYSERQKISEYMVYSPNRRWFNTWKQQ